ncbi:phenylacetate--CoA ligase [Termitidicoccus mucosus]|uniref:Phenylacetate-coenzyme A ligase n=1 Tax=Termitidicoccus mucosus TaxID=1184151 RepID=A0A178IEY8_9BACT|nr:phenylacetate--CoA ligase [Opitutaceae bacterium TSB47]
MKHDLRPECAPDYMEPDALHALQLARLQETVRRCHERVALFRRRMDERGLTPDDVRSLDDLAKLPFTDKNDLRDTYPYGLFAEPMGNVVRIHASSGTTGKPIVVGYTREDLGVWSEVMLRSFVMAGMCGDDVLQNAYGYGLFTGGLGAHGGGERLGATVIPISGGNTERQMMVLKDFGVTAICCTPSYFVHLIEHIKESGTSFSELKLRVGVFGAEPWSDAMRAYIQRESGIRAHDIYGLSEIIGPGVGIECSEQNGMHIFEDHFLMEIVDPDTGAVLPDGAEGELVITTLTKKAFPMIRYRTHDITSIIPGRCACGRTLRRIRRIRSRCDDMMIIRGVNVFPSQIEAALLSVEKALPHYQIILTRKGGLDQMEVSVEVTKEMFSDRVSELEAMRRRLAHAVEHTTGLRIPVVLAEPHTIARSEGKAKRVIDRRHEGEETP